MLAGELKAAIRSMKGAPEIAVYIDGEETWIKVQKASILGALSESFKRKNDETGMNADIHTCRITFEEKVEDEDEDLLG